MANDVRSDFDDERRRLEEDMTALSKRLDEVDKMAAEDHKALIGDLAGSPPDNPYVLDRRRRLDAHAFDRERFGRGLYDLRTRHQEITNRLFQVDMLERENAARRRERWRFALTTLIAAIAVAAALLQLLVPFGQKTTNASPVVTSQDKLKAHMPIVQPGRKRK